MKKRKNKGFTFTEIMVVVGLIGLISTGIYQFYSHGVKSFSSTTTKKDVLADVRGALLWFEKDVKEALVSPAMPLIEFTPTKVTMRKYPKGPTKFDSSGSIITENVTYEFTDDGDKITLKRNGSEGVKILCQTFWSAGSNKQKVGIASKTNDGKTISGFRGYDTGYDPFVVDSPSVSNSQKESHRNAHTIYDKSNTASIELSMVVKKDNNKESVFRTRVFPRTFSFGK